MKKTAFITEPRKHKALKFVLENFISTLPKEWSFQINHGTKNIDYIKKTSLNLFLKGVIKHKF